MEPPSLHYQLVDSSIFLYLSKTKTNFSTDKGCVYVMQRKLCSRFEIENNVNPNSISVPTERKEKLSFYCIIKMYNKVINLDLISFRRMVFGNSNIYVSPLVID